MELTEKRKAFCHEYILDFDGAKSAIRAGYSKKTAKEIASELLSIPEVKKYLAKLQKKRSDKIEVNADWLTKKWLEIANSSIAHLHNSWVQKKEFDQLTAEQKACIEEISTKQTKRKNEEGKIIGTIEWVKIKLYSKPEALKNLGQHIGYYEADKEKANATSTIIILPSNDREKPS